MRLKISEDFLSRYEQKDRDNLKYLSLMALRQREAEKLWPGLRLYPAPADSLKLQVI